MSDGSSLRPGQILTGPLFSQPVRVVTVETRAAGTWLVGTIGTHSERFGTVALAAVDLKSLEILEASADYPIETEVCSRGNAAPA